MPEGKEKILEVKERASDRERVFQILFISSVQISG